jgi:phospholipid/cholesterol/gamma-HCH transport system substrate-binding protein
MVRNRVVAVGAFVVGGLLLFAVGLFLIGDRRMLFDDTFEAYAEFSNLAGLQSGAKVRVAGLDAGEVETIHVPTSPSGKFRVKLRIREDLHPLIRVDSVASIQNDGLVGNKFVQVEAGSDQAQIVAPGGTVKSREPFDLAEMMQRMSDAVDLVTTSVEEVKGRVDELLVSATGVAKEAQLVVEDFRKDARVIMASAQKISRDVSAVVAGVKQGQGTVGKLLTDDALYKSAKSIAAQAEKVVANVKEATEQAKEAMAQAKGAMTDFRGENGPMRGIAGNLQQTLASAKDAMADLAENTEALKRSFFFRGFFNKRGYFDLEDVSLRQYREGALETEDRRVLRIWVGAVVLFEKDANGHERLSDGGRSRLDSAMAEFVKYPRTSPFVVEGYAREITADVRFLISRARTQLVRDYVVGKFGLDPNYVATMAMGAEAHDSPSGDQWDGIALAMFVPASGL